ncbi:MAG TPA: 50S ribosomal protein L11 methyltransferase [Solirubrobacteraceae bacterium]|nr:50S ribosomal protein L11 methyltransferase [Solirubrobacteraceae bacterium]
MLAELLALAPNGLEQRDVGDFVEYAVYGAPGELPQLPDLEAAAGDALVQVSTSELADDWDERWKRFHRPLTIAGRLHVRPPWCPAPGDESGGAPLDIVIDPGQAFGTGAHPTTRLCLELLLELDDPAGGFVDLGCGSGVLAIAAAKLGYAPVTALDNDPAAVAAATGNAAANDVALELRPTDLRRDPLPSAPTYAANLLRPALLALAERLPEPPPRQLIASGLLSVEADAVARAFAGHGLAERERREAGEWTALLLTRA